MLPRRNVSLAVRVAIEVDILRRADWVTRHDYFLRIYRWRRLDSGCVSVEGVLYRTQ
jgi:hypothetical protein